MTARKSITVGLDLGTADYTALVVVERVRVIHGVDEADYWQHPAEYDDRVVDEFRVRAMRRWEPGTTYPAVVADLVDMFAREPFASQATLVFDATGVGVAVRHLLEDERRLGGLGRWWPWAVTVTGAQSSHGLNAAKSDLVGTLQLLLQQRRVRFPASHPLTPVLERELTRFRLKVGASGRTTVDIERSSDTGHGDLTSALALACAFPNTYVQPGFIIERN